MVYTLASNDTPMTSLSINDIPDTPLKSYNFTFIIQPITVDSPYYLKPPTDVIIINGKKTPFYGLENVSLPATYTYLIQEIKVINTSTTATPSFSAFTNVSGLGYTPPPPPPQLIISTILTNNDYNFLTCIRYDLNGNLYIGLTNGIILSFINNVFTIVAGNGNSGYSGDGGQAYDALVGDPRGIDFDKSGNIYFTDYAHHVIRKIDIISGIISTIAGTSGSSGNTGSGGQSTLALLNQPHDLIIDKNDIIYFSCRGGNVINKIDTDGILTTLVGTGSSGYTGDNAQAISANINAPCQLYLNQTIMNLYFADGNNGAIRKVDLNSGIITTVIANLNVVRGLVFDSAGNLYIAELAKITKIDLNGIKTTFAGRDQRNDNVASDGDGGDPTLATFGQCFYLIFDKFGDLIICDFFHKVVRKINTGEQ
jgi:sugar lactone lactonase YvrE